jgi:hypothetical protein
MTDPLEDILAPAVVEWALSIYESFSDRQRADIVQARKALTRHVSCLIGTGEAERADYAASSIAITAAAIKAE